MESGFFFMKLQTQIPLKKRASNLIDYHSEITLLGSCFVENIGEKLSYYKFKNLQNPFGILFHPKAIETLIIRATQEKKYTEDDVFFHNEQWHCFDAHSKLSNPSKEALINQLNSELALTKLQLSKSTHVIITLGTAWVYNLLKDKNTVANCHKLPQNQFEKQLLSPHDIKGSLTRVIDGIKSLNSAATIIFTVSPIRHIKDGFVENTLSKSHLITAVNQVLSDAVVYFPSYEIMMDELRDYRFYSEDMIHPNQTAIHYIWNKFQEVWFSPQAIKTMVEVAVIQKGLQHRPFNLKSEAHQQFLKQLDIKKAQLQAQFSHITF